MWPSSPEYLAHHPSLNTMHMSLPREQHVTWDLATHPLLVTRSVHTQIILESTWGTARPAKEGKGLYLEEAARQS